MTQCYYNDHLGEKDRCKNNAAEEDGPMDCWCSPEHRKLWQEYNIHNKPKEFKRKLTIKEMQAKCLEIGARQGNKQRKLQI